MDVQIFFTANQSICNLYKDTIFSAIFFKILIRLPKFFIFSLKHSSWRYICINLEKSVSK